MLPVNACTTCSPLQQQQQGQTSSQKGIQQSGVGFYISEDRKLQQSIVSQIIHDFPAFSVTTPDFHGNPHMLWDWYFLLMSSTVPSCWADQQRANRKFPEQTLHSLHSPILDVHLHISLCLGQDGITRIYPSVCSPSKS